jgi:hypothetical protein
MIRLLLTGVDIQSVFPELKIDTTVSPKLVVTPTGTLVEFEFFGANDIKGTAALGVETILDGDTIIGIRRL